MVTRVYLQTKTWIPIKQKMVSVRLKAKDVDRFNSGSGVGCAKDNALLNFTRQILIML